jgi:two-component system, chemotaxis family, sensor kinase CheA
MDREERIQRLMSTFLVELEEHAHALNRDVLALEKGIPASESSEIFNTLFRTAHSLKGAARSVNVGVIEAACHRLETILAAIRDARLTIASPVFQLLFETVDGILDVGARLRDKKELAGAPLSALLPRLDAVAMQATPRRPGGGSNESVSPQSAPTAPTGGLPASVRLSVARLDALLAQSGEFLLAQSRCDARRQDFIGLQERVKRLQVETERPDKEFVRVVSAGNLRSPVAEAFDRRRQALQDFGAELEGSTARLTADHDGLRQAARTLDESVRRVRMLPFAEACEGLERMARDLAQAGGKQVEISIEGKEIEMDRSILEGLRDPLLHLVRNAIDHGIEAPSTRRDAGKPPQGRVTVAAGLRGARVEVVVADDGCGLNVAAIQEQARKKKLPEPSDEADLAKFVFLPGFSTSPIITELSGRGIGLDVVKSRVEALHGTVELSFEPGAGTRFTLSTALTLTTIRVLLVKAADQEFALNSDSVRQILRVDPSDIRSVEGRDVLMCDRVPVPLVPLADVLELPATDPIQVGKRAPVVVLGDGRDRVGFVVDELLAEQEVVVKSLGRRLVRVKNIAGGTVRPNGGVTLILNSAELVQTAIGRGPSTAVSTALAEALPANRRRLLVVDDSVTTRALEKQILEAAGYDVLVAADGIQAWALLQERGADLVVSDIEMPHMDGFMLTQRIRTSKQFRDLPVILVTALESEHDKMRGLEVGANAYLPKSSFDQQQLLETITQLV